VWLVVLWRIILNRQLQLLLLCWACHIAVSRALVRRVAYCIEQPQGSIGRIA
jgi:hypothetical protein